MSSDDATNLPQQIREQRGLALKKARTVAGLTAMDLAQRVNDRTAGSDITHHAIYSYERGKVLLSREVGTRIAQTLNLHPGELLLGDPDFAPPPSPAPAARGNVPSSQATQGRQPSTGNPQPYPDAGSLRNFSDPPDAPDRSAADGWSGFGQPVYGFQMDAAGEISSGRVAASDDPRASKGGASSGVGGGGVGGGPAPALRMALGKSAATALPVGNVLYRLLGNAQLGHADMHGYLDVFHLMIRDLQATLASPAATEVKALGLTEGNDAPLMLVRSCDQLLKLAEASLRSLLSQPDPRSAAMYDACHATRQSLGPALRALEKHIRLNDRGLNYDATPHHAPQLMPQVPTYSDDQLAQQLPPHQTY